MKVRGDESGAVTAETAVVLPVMVLVTAMLAWMVAFGLNEVRALDAARETARAFARGDDDATSTAVGKRIAPGGADITVRDDGEDVVVTVRAEVAGPGKLLGFLPGTQVHAEAVALRERPR